jgi:hypothetical protein
MQIRSICVRWLNLAIVGTDFFNAVSLMNFDENNLSIKKWGSLHIRHSGSPTFLVPINFENTSSTSQTFVYLGKATYVSHTQVHPLRRRTTRMI